MPRTAMRTSAAFTDSGNWLMNSQCSIFNYQYSTFSIILSVEHSSSTSVPLISGLGLNRRLRRYTVDPSEDSGHGLLL